MVVTDEFNEQWSVDRGDPGWRPVQYLLSLGYEDINISREAIVTGKVTGNPITDKKLIQISNTGDTDRFLRYSSIWDQMVALESNPDFGSREV